MKFSTMRANIEALTKGRWIDGPVGGQFLVSSTATQRFRNRYQELLRENRVGLRGPRRTAISESCFLRAFCETALHDWREIEDEKGELVPYSVDVAVAELGRPDMVETYDVLVSFGASHEEYRAPEATGDDLGN